MEKLPKLFFNFEDDEQLRCLVDGKKIGVFFDTVAEVLNKIDGPDKGIVFRIKPSQPFSLKHCY